MEGLEALFTTASTGALAAILGIGGIGLGISMVPWAATRGKALFKKLGS